MRFFYPVDARTPLPPPGHGEAMLYFGVPYEARWSTCWVALMRRGSVRGLSGRPTMMKAAIEVEGV